MLKINRLYKLLLLWSLVFSASVFAEEKALTEYEQHIQQWKADFGVWLQQQNEVEVLLVGALVATAGSQDVFVAAELIEKLKTVIDKPEQDKYGWQLAASICQGNIALTSSLPEPLAASYPDDVKKDNLAQLRKVSREQLKVWCNGQKTTSELVKADPANAYVYLSQLPYSFKPKLTEPDKNIIRQAAQSNYYYSYYGYWANQYMNKINAYHELNPLDVKAILPFSADGIIYTMITLAHLQLMPSPNNLVSYCNIDAEASLQTQCLQVAELMRSRSSNMRDSKMANLIIQKLYPEGSVEQIEAARLNSQVNTILKCVNSSRLATANDGPILYTLRSLEGVIQRLPEHGELDAYVLAEQSFFKVNPAEYEYAPASCRELKSLGTEAADKIWTGRGQEILESAPAR